MTASPRSQVGAISRARRVRSENAGGRSRRGDPFAFELARRDRSSLPENVGPAVRGPEVVFRNMAPSEPLLALAREQDALYLGLVALTPRMSRVAIERRELGYCAWVEVAAEHVRCGCAEHRVAAEAVRDAYTDLLRRTMDGAGGCCEAA